MRVNHRVRLMYYEHDGLHKKKKKKRKKAFFSSRHIQGNFERKFAAKIDFVIIKR